jgi:hypothetical protein
LLKAKSHLPRFLETAVRVLFLLLEKKATSGKSLNNPKGSYHGQRRTTGFSQEKKVGKEKRWLRAAANAAGWFTESYRLYAAILS